MMAVRRKERVCEAGIPIMNKASVQESKRVAMMVVLLRKTPCPPVDTEGSDAQTCTDILVC
jgi:hypothetical protein